MKAVLDTSTAVQIMASRRRLMELKALMKRGLIIASSQYLLNELERTLHIRFGLTQQQSRARTNAFAKITLIVKPIEILELCRDPTDDPIIATAVAAGADFLLTEDKDLLEIKAYRDIKIINLAEFLRTIGDQN